MSICHVSRLCIILHALPFYCKYRSVMPIRRFVLSMKYSEECYRVSITLFKWRGVFRVRAVAICSYWSFLYLQLLQMFIILELFLIINLNRIKILSCMFLLIRSERTSDILTLFNWWVFVVRISQIFYYWMERNGCWAIQPIDDSLYLIQLLLMR